MAGFNYISHNNPNYYENSGANPQRPPFPTDKEPLPAQRISVSIKLKDLSELESIKAALKQAWPDCDIHGPNNYVITVSGYPPSVSFGRKEVLNIVRHYDEEAAFY